MVLSIKRRDNIYIYIYIYIYIRCIFIEWRPKADLAAEGPNLAEGVNIDINIDLEAGSLLNS